MQGNIRHGFVYERVPHIMLKSIANNAEIDVIWEKWQETLEPLRDKLNAALKYQSRIRATFSAHPSSRRKPFTASRMPTATQRTIIFPLRQRLVLCRCP